MERVYIAIDLKSFYASVECVERESDPLTANLVVADESRTAKTICLAVTPSLKKYGLSGRSRLFEVEQKAKEIEERTGKKLEYIVAVPRMGLYIEYSSKIYSIYLKYFSKDDITVYSIDEVFIDATDYMKLYNMTARQLTAKVIEDVYDTTGITATAGIAPNLYLCKIAMDIVAKHIQADSKGVRIAELSVNDYRKMLWGHTPLTDFWRVGPGISRQLEKHGIKTMGDIARMSLEDEDWLYKKFGVDASSLCSGQVLKEPYTFEDARIVVGEMADELALDLVDKGFVTDSIALNVTYDRVNVDKGTYKGEIHVDRYGREVPQGLNKSVSLTTCTSSSKQLREAFLDIYDKYTDRKLYIRKLNLTVANLTNDGFQQFDMFTDQTQLEREKKMQHAMLDIKKKYGKNAVMKANNLQSKATAIERNGQIGGHRA